MPPSTREKTRTKRDEYYRDRRRRKVCTFCADKTVMIDYKEVNRLRRYLSERAKIEPSAAWPERVWIPGRVRHSALNL